MWLNYLKPLVAAVGTAIMLALILLVHPPTQKANCSSFVDPQTTVDSEVVMFISTISQAYPAAFILTPKKR